MHLIAVGLPVTIFLGVLALLEVGKRVGARRREEDPEAPTGLNALDGAVFGLLGLLLAFTFSGAASRFDQRRELIVKEANAIGTAYLRLDILPPDQRSLLQAKFREYLDSRLETYRKVPDMAAVHAELAHSIKLQGEIWSLAAAAAKESPAQAAAVVLFPALNEMIDIVTTRTMATKMHPPVVVFFMLAVLSLVCALLAGYGLTGTKARPWLHQVGFAVVLSVTVYIILDLEYPRLGLIRVDSFDEVLVDVRESMR